MDLIFIFRHLIQKYLKTCANVVGKLIWSYKFLNSLVNIKRINDFVDKT